MADGTGIDVAEALGPERSAGLVLFTGGAITARAQEFLRATPLEILRKPIEPAALARVLEAASARRAS
jgi:hypothetical protein